VILVGVLLSSAGLAGYHAGVEWDWWEGPAACAAGGAPILDVDPGDLLGSLNEAGMVGVVPSTNGENRDGNRKRH